jgi:transketolase N-terminal domain/subunit
LRIPRVFRARRLSEVKTDRTKMRSTSLHSVWSKPRRVRRGIGHAARSTRRTEASHPLSTTGRISTAASTDRSALSVSEFLCSRAPGRESFAPRPEWPRRWERVSLLSKIDGPEDLRRLSRREIARVAAELRQELIAVGAAAGGHFAAGLGAVELTVALHYVFDTPRDRLVWDVGHQAYGHKALTGRRGELRRIKRSDGPSGFLRRTESPYDAFGAGHAGTSVSAALGIVEALRAVGDEGKVVAVIGDGGATAGMSFEALNHAGHLGSDLRVVFNDNGMSIAPSSTTTGCRSRPT